MIMPPRLRRFALTVHVICSIGWIGALAAFLALAITGLTSQDADIVRIAYGANAIITAYVIVPLSLAALLTGIVQSLATEWGLFRNFWVLIKLLIVLAATFLLLMKTGQIDYLATAASETALAPAGLRGLRVSVVAHAAGGLLVLLWAAALGMYKPRGLTRHGWRQKQAMRQRSIASSG
ncbi:hypothetical protein [Sphingomonas sp.]|nr:hypothetical protein [Sphingomonas sp.]MBN8812334.1 hypothetical protein [Sphingomonas sp.]OJY48027.1 MAG: hypothetical protein BGP17_02450 [Sphingomonas sp. 67-41]